MVIPCHRISRLDDDGMAVAVLMAARPKTEARTVEARILGVATFVEGEECKNMIWV